MKYWTLLILGALGACLRQGTDGTVTADASTDSAAVAGPVAAPLASTDSFPAIHEESCEGESCMARFPVRACRDVALLAQPLDGADVRLALRAGDSADVRTDVHLRRPGIVILRRDFVLSDDVEVTDPRYSEPREDTIRFAAGDTLYLLQYGELGSWVAWFRGTRLYLMEFWGGEVQAERGPRDSAQAEVAVGVRAPDIAYWWRVTLPDGRMGWWRNDESSALIPAGEYGAKWGWECPR